MKAVLLLPLLFSFGLFGQKDTINVTDSLGLKQGHWVYFGGDFPNSGVSSSEILEEGDFIDNQRVGIWYRYGAASQVKAVMLFRIDKKTRSSVRDQFYNYVYHSNGQLKRKPIVGRCRSMSDYFEYDETGLLKEAELFDSVCNTSYKLQRIEKGEMDSVSIFIIDHQFVEQISDSPEAPKNTIQFEQTGEFCVDYNHQIFQLGHFEKGQFIDGREYLFDEMIRAQLVRFYENGKLVKTMMRKSS